MKLRFVSITAVGALASAAVCLLTVHLRTPGDRTGMNSSTSMSAARISPTTQTGMHRSARATVSSPAKSIDSRIAMHVTTVELLERAINDAAPEDRGRVFDDVLARLAIIDAARAARIAELETDPFLREQALRIVAQCWGRIDAAAAGSWANSLGNWQERENAIANVALELARTNPTAAVALLDRRQVSDESKAAFAGIVEQWAEKDFAATMAWSEAQPAGKQRDLLLDRLIFLRAGQDPADAARIATEAYAENHGREDAFASIALSWGARDLAAARDWANTLDPGGRQRVNAELALLGQSARQSPDASAGRSALD